MESSPGAGSTIRFTTAIELPADAQDLTVSLTELHGLPILVVDDHQSNHNLLAELLQGWGARPPLADGSESAARLLEKATAAGLPFRILMDLEMPVMGGIEATKVIRSREDGSGPHIPIFALTAHALKSVHEQCKCAGLDGYLTKPLRLPELRAAIEGVTMQARRPDTLGARRDHQNAGAVT